LFLFLLSFCSSVRSFGFVTRYLFLQVSLFL
jgi:hypothetical protein